MGIGLVVAIFIYIHNSNPKDNEIRNLKEIVQHQLADTKTALESHSLKNAMILGTYGQQLEKTKPEYTPIVTAMEKDATPESPAFKTLEKRVDAVSNAPSTIGAGRPQDILRELQLLKVATDPNVFNDSLTDSINVLADLSGGSLPRINAPDKSKEPDMPAGSQLVGNPNYGQWQEHNGQSFWEWYGEYSMFRSLFGGRMYDYNSWYGQRPWSYYNDYGRYNYGSLGERRQFEDVDHRQRKTYGANEGRRGSMFARKSNPIFGGASAGSGTPTNTNMPVSSEHKDTVSHSRRTSSYSRSSRGRR